MLKQVHKKSLSILLVILSLLSCDTTKKEEEKTSLQEEKEPIEVSNIFFDDFSYNNLDQFYANNWKARDQKGHPGISGADWSADGISFHQNIEGAQNGIVRMTSFIEGVGENTRQTQFCHQRKYLEGTYASRIYFRDKPTSGPDGDEVIETFYAISPLKAPMDPDYSEVDFEYLPNGGWGEGTNSAMWSTTWETFQLEPWTKVNEFSRKEGSYNGWHTLVFTVKDNKVSYYVDGELFSVHSEKVYPEVPMSINFNLWFMPKGADGSNGPIDSKEKRVYEEDIDWVFHKVGDVLTTEEIEEYVRNIRNEKIKYVDNVAEMNPPLACPCGL